MFAGYILKKTASGTTSYIVESPSGGISKTTGQSNNLSIKGKNQKDERSCS